MTTRDVLLSALDRAWDAEGWHAPLVRAVAGMTAAQAAWQARPGSLTARQLTSHVAFWEEESLRELQGLSRRAEAEDNDATFGAPGAPADAAGWATLVARLEAAHRGLREHLASMPESAFDEPRVSFLVSGLAAHASYHGGEIVQLRKLQGAWPG